jgi:thioredoxin 1
MKTEIKRTLVIAGAVVLAAGLVAVQGNRPSQSGSCCPSILSMTASAAEAAKSAATNAAAKAGLPRLVDLGADKCIPCKMMTPVLADLKTSYAGQMEVEFIDVWKDPEAGKAYRINLIPTQIFFDATGRELYRHQGFFSKKDILAKWKELGVEFKGKAEQGAKK